MMQMEPFILFLPTTVDCVTPLFFLTNAVCDLVIAYGLTKWLESQHTTAFYFPINNPPHSIEEKTQQEHVCERTLQNLEVFYKIFVFYFCRPPFCSRKRFEVAY